MNYLLDRKNKRNKIIKIALSLVLLFILFYFRTGVLSGLSGVVHAIFRPVLIVGNNVGGKLSNISSFFRSKNSLLAENENLKSRLTQREADMSAYNSIVDENNQMKEILGRKNEKVSMVLAAILEKPNQSPYDTLVIDTGTREGVKVGETVFALGNVPIGRIAEVYSSTSKVILFSSPGEKKEVVISGSKSAFFQLVGRGGGNFETILPRDFSIDKGTEASLPGITPYVVGVVQTIISDPRDAFTKALLTSPVNIFELKFVEIKQ